MKELCVKLAKAESEEEVIAILKKKGYWDNPLAWRYYGDQENNIGPIGGQQASADAALVEKIINSIDAMLMRECLRQGIDPKSKEAPQTIFEASELFFDIKNGNLAYVSPKKRSEIAENILVVATGEKDKPCYSIIDKGEGQSPLLMPNTFLSLIKSNKISVNFVQGKYNQGGSGALRFCGENKLQLIISRRHPELIDPTDNTAENWGFTIVRREYPEGNVRSSCYKYLAPNGQIPMFFSENLPLIPGDYPNAYEKPLEWGSFIKLYNYKLEPALKSPIMLDLNYKLSTLLPNIPLPAKIIERRAGYRAHTYDAILSGLNVRLDEDRSENLEPGFPSTGSINIQANKIEFQIYAFKKDVKMERYRKKEGIIFTINGQSHGSIPKTFFGTKAVKMDYLVDSILVIADCTNVDLRTRENLFMTSRDRLEKGELFVEIQNQFTEVIRNHPGLRELQSKRWQEATKDKLQDSKPLVEILEKVIKTSPVLSTILQKGIRITDPFDTTTTGTDHEFKGKEFPTFFQLIKKFEKDTPKHCPINLRYRVQFETDVRNDYFKRDISKGEHKLIIGTSSETKTYILNLWNGIATLTVDLPPESKQGDDIEYRFEVTDETRMQPIKSSFFVHVDPPMERVPGGNGKRKKSTGTGKGDRKKTGQLNYPNTILVYQNGWNQLNKFNKESALFVQKSPDDNYDFYINMDNLYLKTEIKGMRNIDPKLLEAQYEYGMVLIGMSLIRAFELESDEKSHEDDTPLSEKIAVITKAISPVLLPMISTLHQLLEE